MPELIIDDSNYLEFVGNGEFVERPGGVYMLGAKPRQSAYGKGAATAVDESFFVPEEEWDDWIARKDEEKSWLADMITPEQRRAISEAENQRRLSYCWSYCVVIGAMVVRLRQSNPLIMLSGESVGGPIQGWANRGGWPDKALAQIMKYGACPQEYMDAPNSLSPKRWKSNWEQAALDFRVEEYQDLDVPSRSKQASVSAALRSWPTAECFDWWGHAIMGGLKVRKVGRDYQTLHWNSWGVQEGEEGWVWLAGNKSIPSGGIFCPRVVRPYGAPISLAI